MGNPPSPDEGPTYDHLKDPTIQKKVIDALVKSGMNINVTSFEMYHQKGKLYIKTAE